MKTCFEHCFPKAAILSGYAYKLSQRLIRTNATKIEADSGFLHAPPVGRGYAGLVQHTAVRHFVRRADMSLKKSNPVQFN